MNDRTKTRVLICLLFLSVHAAALGQEAPAGKDELGDLPLVEVPAAGPAGDVLAVFISGDGGWAPLVRAVSARMAGQGVSVVGWNAQRYFSRERTPEEVTRDVERVLRHYLAAWKKERVLLMGYSFGADVMPFVVNRLSGDLSSRVTLVALLGLADTAHFEFHWLSRLGKSYPETERPVMPEMEKLKGRPVVCVCGDDETGSLCRQLPGGWVQVECFEGGHHFGGHYDAVADAVLKHLP